VSNINQLAQASIPVYNAQVPQEGPKVIPLRLDFSAADEYDIDLKPLTDRDFISMVQTLFVDTTGCMNNLTITVSLTGQTITIVPNRQGYYPVLVPNPARIAISTTSGPASLPVILCNMPIAPGQWATA